MQLVPLANVASFLAGCVVVADEAECTDGNGIFLGNNEDDPPTPCADQTDCPPVWVADFNDCATFGDYMSYFTGDCYIDQGMTSTQQPQRVGGPFTTQYPIGCL